jgi:peptidoglycan/LPS O-acetylase OafA/YrhL
VSRLSQISGSRPIREPKIKPTPPVAAPRFGGTYLADMLVPDRNSFAIIRMAMALAVLVSHSYWFAIGTVGAQPLVKWTGHSLGEHAVQVFFLLSGILVAQSLHRSGSIVDYICARGLRIFPALLVCVFLTAFVLGPIVTNLGMAEYLKDSRVAAYIVKTLTLSTGSAPLPGVFTDVPLANLVNVSLWTLKFEVLCYFALAGLAIAGLMTERYRVWSTIGLVAFVGLVFLRQPSAAIPYTAVDNIRYLMLFFFTGVLAFQCRKLLWVHGLILWPLAAIFVASIGTRFVEISAAMFLGYAMLWISTFSFGPLRAFTNKNDYSYGTYIYAGPIQQMIVHFLPGFAPWVVTAFALGIAVPLAVYSWELIERPALALRQPIRDWFLTLGSRINAARALLSPAHAMRSVASAPAAAFSAAMAKVGGVATVGSAAGVELASVEHGNEVLTKLPRRQRLVTLVGPAVGSTAHLDRRDVPPLPRRQRQALELKLLQVSPEVVSMHQSKAFAAAVAKRRAQTNLTGPYSPGTYSPGFDAQRTPYARNWLMSLGWLAHQSERTQHPTQSETTLSLQEPVGQRQRPRGVSGDQATRSITKPAPPAPASLATDALVEAAKPRLTLRTWLAAIASSRHPAVETPQPVAEITEERLAKALRPRTQTRPKWTVPSTDATDDNRPDPLPV